MSQLSRFYIISKHATLLKIDFFISVFQGFWQQLHLRNLKTAFFENTFHFGAPPVSAFDQGITLEYPWFLLLIKEF